MVLLSFVMFDDFRLKSWVIADYLTSRLCFFPWILLHRRALIWASFFLDRFDVCVCCSFDCKVLLNKLAAHYNCTKCGNKCWTRAVRQASKCVEGVHLFDFAFPPFNHRATTQNMHIEKTVCNRANYSCTYFKCGIMKCSCVVEAQTSICWK